MRLKRIEGDNTFSHTVFSMEVTAPIGHAHLHTESLGFQIQFKSDWIKTSALKHLDFLEHLETAAMIQDMYTFSHTA